MINGNSDGYVRSGLNNEVTVIEFFHPQSNSLPLKILDELAQAIQHAGRNDETKLIILRSAGEKAFCAGASFDELSSIQNAEEGLRFFTGFAQVINAMRTCPKFIIARVQGKCVGGGVGLVAASDYAIATERAEIRLSELAIGIGPFVVGPAVERRMGPSAFSQLAIDACMWRDAQWAGRKGLFAEVHPTTERMDESIAKLSYDLSRSSPSAMAEMKKIFWEGTENWDQLLLERAGISGSLVTSSFTRNAIEQFKAKK
jgi:methylglutaconyl-CoA hydratase